MRKHVVFLVLIVLALNIIGLFQVKHKVQNLRKDLSEINRQLLETKEEVNVLNAEWAYLNQPERIKRLADAYLGMHYATVAQVKNMDDMKSQYMLASQDSKTPSVTPTLKPILSSLRRY